MNKNLRLSLIAVVCSLAITACSSSNKGATRYENLVKNKTEEAIKKAEEKVKRAQDSETAKKLADLEKKKKELEAELAKKQNDNADAVEKKEPVVVNPTDKVLTAEEAKKALEKAFKDNGIISGESKIISLSGSNATINDTKLSISNIDKNSTNQNLNTLVIDGHSITLFDTDAMKSHLASTYNEEIEGKIFDITTENGKGKVGSLPRKSTGSDFEHMRYGYYTDKDGKTSLFVQGYLTPTTAAQTGEETKSPFNYWDASRGNNSSPQPLYSLPVEKVYEYKGTTFYGNGNQYAEYATTAYADFDNKKVQVNVLNTTGENKLTFGGNINNNTFEGTHNGIVTKGAFFGKRASDIGGIFYQTEGAEKGNNGVFGATQQNCGYSSCTPIENKNLKTFEIK